jgi:hypothetical protein
LRPGAAKPPSCLVAGGLPAVRAFAVQGDLVVLGAKPEAVRQQRDRPLQRWVVERDKLAALVADHVVVVLAGRVDDLVSGDAVAEVQAIDQIMVLEEIEDAVDACAADRPRAASCGAEGILYLERAQGAVLAGEKLDERVPGGPFLMARPLEDLARVLGPIGSWLRSHISEHSRIERQNEIETGTYSMVGLTPNDV